MCKVMSKSAPTELETIEWLDHAGDLIRKQMAEIERLRAELVEWKKRAGKYIADCDTLDEAIAAERERCAQRAYEAALNWLSDFAAGEIAAAIRKGEPA